MATVHLPSPSQVSVCVDRQISDAFLHSILCFTAQSCFSGAHKKSGVRQHMQHLSSGRCPSSAGLMHRGHVLSWGRVHTGVGGETWG